LRPQAAAQQQELPLELMDAIEGGFIGLAQQLGLQVFQGFPEAFEQGKPASTTKSTSVYSR